MNHGFDEQGDTAALENALTLLIATFEHNKLFFAPRVPQIYEQLRRLLRYCRHHQRSHNQAFTQSVVQEELLRLFGVRVMVPLRRQLSLLAGMIRYVLVNYARMQQHMNTRGGIQLLMRDIHRRLNAATATTEVDLLTIDLALTQLAEYHLNSVRLLELRYFGRLSARDVALEVNTSMAEVERELRFAKAWLLAYLQVRLKS